jgi:hypothetical protein
MTHAVISLRGQLDLQRQALHYDTTKLRESLLQQLKSLTIIYFFVHSAENHRIRVDSAAGFLSSYDIASFSVVQGQLLE